MSSLILFLCYGLQSIIPARCEQNIPFLNRLCMSKRYIPKKSKVLTGYQVLRFVKDSPNETDLLHKVVLVICSFGGLRRNEMVKLTINDIQDKGCVLLVKVSETKTGLPRVKV